MLVIGGERFLDTRFLGVAQVLFYSCAFDICIL